MFVIGTAGHVDHGKSTLVEALTGIDPDRLAEEKAREMTIDLGFAWLTLPIHGTDHQVGVVDVPGHRDFIENMLAGVGSIDLALFVVAADEGVMPQTREHLAILDILGVPSGVVALTKTDLVTEPDWLDLVTMELEETLEGTVLEQAPIVPVSARTGAGIQALREKLAGALSRAEARPDFGRPRMNIDRVFTISGFGTVVTGTLVDGMLSIGDKVLFVPAGREGRIRGLQSHNVEQETVGPGSRVAVNVSGVAKDEIQRGDVLAYPQTVRSTILFDAIYKHLASNDGPLKHNTEVKVFVGTSEQMARVRVIGTDAIQPGENGWIQLAMTAPVATLSGDRFIVRRPSPASTIGGGTVLDPHPGRRHRRYRDEVIERLQTLASGDPTDRLFAHLERIQPAEVEKFRRQASTQAPDFQENFEKLLSSGRVIAVGNYVMTAPWFQSLRDRLHTTVDRYHEQHPLRLGMPREELRNKLRLQSDLYGALLLREIESGAVVDTGSTVAESDHEVVFSPVEKRTIADLMRLFEARGIQSPSVKEARSVVGDEVFDALVDRGEIVIVSDDVVYLAHDYAQFVELIKGYLRKHGQAKTADIRDMLGTSRKYAIALLEKMDQEHITRRHDDVRRLV